LTNAAGLLCGDAFADAALVSERRGTIKANFAIESAGDRSSVGKERRPTSAIAAASAGRSAAD